jgi:hypothetical protein
MIVDLAEVDRAQEACRSNPQHRPIHAAHGRSSNPYGSHQVLPHKRHQHRMGLSVCSHKKACGAEAPRVSPQVGDDTTCRFTKGETSAPASATAIATSASFIGRVLCHAFSCKATSRSSVAASARSAARIPLWRAM